MTREAVIVAARRTAVGKSKKGTTRNWRSDDMAAAVIRALMADVGQALDPQEIDDAVKENLAYLSAIRKAVKSAAKKRNPMEALAQVDIESCGKSRIYLGGLAEDLHKRNLRYLYRQMAAEEVETQPAKDL